MRCKCGNKALRGKGICLDCFIKAQSKERTKPKHEEDDIQEAFFNAARLAFPKLGKLLFAIPNGGKRNAREAARFKRQGVVRGVSDIICLVPNGQYPFLCIETKTEDGTQSDHQIIFQQESEQAGGLYLIFRSAAEGIEILKSYLATTNYK